MKRTFPSGLRMLKENKAIEITRPEARTYLLRYHHLLPPRSLAPETDILPFIRKVGCIQYDPLNTTGRNADLVLQSRFNNYKEADLYRLLYETRVVFDGWDKNMSIIPVDDWPCFERKRRKYRERYKKHSSEFQPVKAEILEKLQQEEYISSKDVDGKRKVDWAWAPTDIGRAVLESMYHSGDLLIHHREGSRKFYGPTERLLPRKVVDQGDPNPKNEAFCDWYVKRRIASIGLLWNRAGGGWLGSEVKKNEREQSVARLLERGEIIRVKIADIPEIFYMPKEGLEYLPLRSGASAAGMMHCNSEPGGGLRSKEAALIAPLDNLLWDRRLVETLFGFHYRWEVYTPVKDRRYGYYVLPVLYGDRFVARCEPVMDRKSRTLTIKGWWWEDGVQHDQEMDRALSRCFHRFAEFLGAQSVVR